MPAMSLERPTVEEKFMSMNLMTALQNDDADALMAEITSQQTQKTDTSAWLETVSLQFGARDMYVRQKNMLVQLLVATPDQLYRGLSVQGKAGVLEEELRRDVLRLGPPSAEIADADARRAVRAERIGQLSRYGADTLLKGLYKKGRQPASSVPSIDPILYDARLITSKQIETLRLVARFPKEQQHQKIVPRGSDAIKDIDRQLFKLVMGDAA